MSIVIQCPMCQDFDPEATCRFCSLIPQIHVDEWKRAVTVAKDMHATCPVVVNSHTLLSINTALSNAIAAQQPAQAAADARDALLTESARWEKSDHRLAVWEALRVLGSRMGVMVTREDQYAALATHQQRQDGGEA